MLFIDGVDGGTGKYSDKDDDHDNRTDAACKGFIL